MYNRHLIFKLLINFSNKLVGLFIGGIALKSVSDRSRDFFYDIIDYLIIFAVVAGVIFIINWRLGIVFDNKISTVVDAESTIDKALASSETIASDSGIVADEKLNVVEVDTSNSTDSDAIKVDTTEALTKKETPDTKTNVEVKNITLKIPSGSSTGKIAQIVVDSKLASSSEVFLKRVSELKLETKLQSGTFELKSNSDLDTVIKKIAGRK